MVYPNNHSDNGSERAPNADEGAPEGQDDNTSDSESESEEERSVDLLESEQDSRVCKLTARVKVQGDQIRLYGQRLSSMNRQITEANAAHQRTRTSLTNENTSRYTHFLRTWHFVLFLA